MAFKKLLNKINVKQLFLIDSLGALLTAVMLGLVMVQFENHFGMPHEVLHYLASIACVFSIYSFLCFLRLTQNWRPYLKTIAIANLSYCGLTMVLVIFLFQKLTIVDLVYFALEIIVVTTLVFIELKTAVKLAENVE